MAKSISLKIEEMIDLGVAYALNCNKCMKIHKKAAYDAGVSIDEMSEALSVAEGVVKGARGVTKNEAEKIFGRCIFRRS